MGEADCGEGDWLQAASARAANNGERRIASALGDWRGTANPLNSHGKC